MEGICGRMCDACTWKEQLDWSRLSGWAGAPVFRRLSHCGLLPGEGAYGMCDLHLFYRLCPAAKRYAPEPAVGRGGRAGAPGAAGPECPCAGQVAVAAVLAGDSQCFQQHSDHGYCGGSGFQLPESLEMCWHF